MSSALETRVAPWYRHRWPWFLMLGPALVLVAGAYTAWLAFSTNDGLVARDYYKRGLLINRTLQRDQNAAASRIAAMGVWNNEGTALAVQISGVTRPPGDLVLKVTSGTAGIEQSIGLVDIGGGWYEASWRRPPHQHWRAVLETEDWRLIMVRAVPDAPLQFIAAAP